MTTFEFWLIICNAILGLATVCLAIVTLRLELAWKKCSAEQVTTWGENTARQISVQAWLALEARFNSPDMKRARAQLAQVLMFGSIDDGVEDDVLNFFESVGTAIRLNVLDKKLAESSFSLYVNYWWRASQAYVNRERKRTKGDATLFANFEALAERWKDCNPELDAAALKRFLLGESRLAMLSTSQTRSGDCVAFP